MSLTSRSLILVTALICLTGCNSRKVLDSLETDLWHKHEQVKRLETQFPQVEELAWEEAELSRKMAFLRAQSDYQSATLERLNKVKWDDVHEVELSFP